MTDDQTSEIWQEWARERVLAVDIPGKVLGKGRPRVTKSGRTYTPQKTVNWEDSAGFVMTNEYSGDVLQCPLALRVVSVKKRPQRLFRKKDPDHRLDCPKNPDWDNVGKIVSDALVKCGIVSDDKWIVDARVITLYGRKQESPRVEIELYKLDTGRLY